MANEELSFTLKFVTKDDKVVTQTATTIKEINQSVKDLQEQLDNTDLGSETWKEYNQDLKNSKKALDQATQSQMSLSEKLSAIPGPVGAASQSVLGLGKAFMALIANPIGAAIAGIAIIFTTLYKALTSTEKGMFALNAVMGALSGLLSPIITLLQNVALVLVDGVLAGITALQNGLEALGFDSFAKASRDSMALAKSINQVEEAEGDLAVERAKQNKELTEAREILADTNVSLEDRQKALKQVQKSEESLAAKEVKLNEQRLANIRAEIKLKGASKELNDAEEQALISLYNTQQSQAATRRKNIKAEAALVKEAAADEKALDDERKKRAEDAAAKQKEKQQKVKEAADYERQLNLELITDEQEKALKSLEIAKNKELETINALAVSETKKSELRVKLEQKTQNDIAKIKQTADEKQKAQEKAIQDTIDKLRTEFADKAVETERERLLSEIQSRLDAQIKEIDSLKITEEQKTQLKLDAQKAYNVKRDSINQDQDAKELQQARDKAFKEFDERSKIEQLNFEASIEGSMEQFDIQRQMLETNLAKELLMYDGNEAAQTLIKDKYAKKRNEIDRAEQRAKLELLNGVLGAIASLAGEETAIGKAAAIAMTGINTYMAASDMFNKIQGAIPPPLGQILGGLAAAIVVAAGAKQALKIAGISTNVPNPKEQKLNAGGMVGGTGAGDSVSTLLTPGESVINARSTSMFAPLLSSINQIGGGARFNGTNNNDANSRAQLSMMGNLVNTMTGPIKTYVVSSEISNQQEFDRKIVSRSTI
jgi:hypothetical protein